MNTKYDNKIPDLLIKNYFKNLINQFYKILPIKESGEDTLQKYMESLMRELIGCGSLIDKINNDSLYLCLLCTLQYLIDNNGDINVIRSEVFKSISICKKLENKYSDVEG